MILHWTYPNHVEPVKDCVADMHKSPGSKLVGIKYRGYRPNSLSMNRVDLQYCLDHPDYLRILINALR